jgi:hypothetical protein
MLNSGRGIHAGLLLPGPGAGPGGGERGARLHVKHLLRGGVLLIAASSVAVFALAVARGQQTAWPLMNISQYAAQYPGVYIFRIGTMLCAAAMLLIARAFWQESRGGGGCSSSSSSSSSSSIDRNPNGGSGIVMRAAGDQQLRPEAPGPWTAVGFVLSAIGLGGAGVVSCYENNSVHTPLAFLMFVSQAAIQTGPLLCRQHRRRACPRTLFHACRVAGCLYLWLSLLFTALMAAHVIPKVNTTISVLEWSGSSELLVYLWWYAAQHDDTVGPEDDGDSNNGSGGGGFGSDAGSIGDDLLYNDI